MTSDIGALRLVTDVDSADIDFAALGRLRRGLGELYDFIQVTANSQGCSTSMYQLLLAVKTSRRGGGPDIGVLATALGVRHPSAAEMVRKAETAGFVTSEVDLDDRRRMLVELTEAGECALARIADDHLAELRRVRAGFIAALRALG